MKRNPFLHANKPKNYTSPILENLHKEMKKDSWSVKLKRWISLKVWIITCNTRKYWDKSYEGYIFKKN